MWLLNLLPDWIFYGMLVAGVIGIVASKFVPLFYRSAIQAASAVVFIIGVFMAGAIHDNASWLERVAEMEKKVAEAKVESVKENIKIVEKVVVKREYYREKGNDIVQYVDREIVKYDESCKIPKEVIDTINKAATK
jgi:hypothetical protein